MKYIKVLMMLVVAIVMTSCSNEEKNAHPVYIYISGEGIANGEVTLKAQESVQLNLSYWPEYSQNEGIEYLSDNENIATVSNTGLVKALNDGTATITVKCNIMPLTYMGIERQLATSTLKVNVIGNTLKTSDDPVSQDQADSRQLAW
jgi:hypothetical protein